MNKDQKNYGMKQSMIEDNSKGAALHNYGMNEEYGIRLVLRGLID